MLQIGVHNGDKWGARRQHTLDASPGETTPADTAQAAHAKIDGSDGPNRLRGAVRRIVIDKDRFPDETRECRVQPLDQWRNVAAFPKRRNDDRQLRRAGLVLRARGLQMTLRERSYLRHGPNRLTKGGKRKLWYRMAEPAASRPCTGLTETRCKRPKQTILTRIKPVNFVLDYSRGLPIIRPGSRCRET